MQRLALLLAPAALSLAAAAAQADPGPAPPGFMPLAGAGAAAGEPAPAYVRVVEPRAAMDVVMRPPSGFEAGPSYRVASYAVQCEARAVKHRGVRSFDAASHLPVSTLAMPRTVWHRPAADSIEAMALAEACAQ